MHRIYKAARQCGYLQNVIEPLDARDAKISQEKNCLLYVLAVKESQWVR